MRRTIFFYPISPYVITVFCDFFFVFFFCLFFFISLQFARGLDVRKVGLATLLLSFCYTYHRAVVMMRVSIAFCFYRLFNDEAHTISRAVNVFLFFFPFSFLFLLDTQAPMGITGWIYPTFPFTNFLFSFQSQDGWNK